MYFKQFQNNITYHQQQSYLQQFEPIIFISIMNKNIKLNINTLLLLLVLTSIVNGFDFQELRVNSSVLTTNVVSAYTVTFNRGSTNLGGSTAFATSPLNTSSTLTLTFPTQFVITPGVLCSYQINSTGTFLSNNCTLNNNQIIFSNIFAASSIIRSVVVQISNVLNPYPAGRTSPFTGTIGIDVAVVNGPNGINSFVTIAPALCSSSFTYVDNLVSSNQNLIISLTLKNSFPQTGTIGIQFPLTRKWSNQLNPARQLLIGVSMVCRRISSNIKSGIQCSATSSTATLVTVSSIVDSSLAAGTKISFSIDNLISPPTNQPLDSLTVTTFLGTNAIDSCSSRVEGLIPKTIPSTQFSITQKDNLPMVVNQQYTIRFQFTTIDFMSQTDSIQITFPSGVTIDNFASSQISGTLAVDSANSNFYDSKLTLKLDGVNALQPAQFVVTVSNFVAPPNTLTTNNFFFEIVSNGYPRMNSRQSITAISGPLSGNVSMVNAVVNADTRYVFSIRISNPITSSGKIKITFPFIISLSISQNCAVLSGLSLLASPKCAFNSIQNSITITNLNTSSNSIPAQTFILTINSVRNPPSTKKTGEFLIQTFYTDSNSMMVDSGSIEGVTATIGTIDHTKVIISSSSLVTSAIGVTYNIEFLSTHGISTGGYVTMNLPKSIVLDLSTATNNCNLNVNDGVIASTPCTFQQTNSTYIARFTNPFPSSPVNQNATLRFSILNSFTNPISTQPVSPFSVSTFESDGSSIATTLNTISYSVTTPSNLLSHTVQRISNKNAQLTKYSLTISQIVNLPPNSIVIVALPSAVLAQSFSSCSMTYAAATTSVACGLQNNTFKVITIGQAIPAGIQFTLSFTNIRNPYSFAPLTGFQATTKTPNDAFFFSRGTNTNSLSNNAPTQFKLISYTYAPQQLNQPLSLSLTFEFSQLVIMPQYLLISIDSYFNVGTLSCNSFVDFSGVCSIEINNTLRVTGTFNNSVMGLTISGFSSPNVPPSVLTYSTVGSFTSNNHKIDQSLNNITFSLNCNLPCKTCSSSNRSSCSSCYNNNLVTSALFYHASTSNCYVNCPDTTYNNNSTLLCSPCDSNCLNCRASPTFCTKCRPSSPFPYLNISGSVQVCVSGCVSGMYPDTSIDPASCVFCKSPCQTCQTQTKCLTCKPGFFYLGNNSCLTECPIDFTIANNVTNTCQFCSGQCRTCSGNLNNCTSCNSPKVFFNGSCQNSCPAGGKLAPFNGVCTPCAVQCLTCGSSINFCTSCNASSIYVFFVGNTCIEKCPIFFYNQTSTQQCISCASANINCVNCSSASTCFTCDATFVLHQNQCLNYVHTGFVNISGKAVACSGDCQTCSVSTTNCTKCKTLNLQDNLCVTNCRLNSIPINQVCSSCLYPCLTCSVLLFNCTSCVTNATPPVYLSSNSCQNTCPDFTYPNNTNFRCTPCTNNCLLCSSATVCISCTNNTFILNSSCVSPCPSGMVGVSAVCQNCTNNCKTCSGSNNICLTCLNGFYLKNSSCVNNCGQGLFIDFVSQSCIGCTFPCKTCSNTTSTCLSCETGILINNQCQIQCPNGLFPQVGKCQLCPQNCSRCSSLSNCSACTGSNKLFNNFCIQNCPQTHAFFNNGICNKCSTQNCFSCTSANVCLTCNAGFLLLRAICLGSCPGGFVSNGTHCEISLDVILQQKSSGFPVPFTIAGVVMIIACLMSRLQFNQTYLSGAIYSLIGILEILALLLFMALYFFDHYQTEPIPFYIGFCAVAFLYFLNIIAFITQSLFLAYQKQFQDWNSSKCNKVFYFITNFLSLLICHKFRNILFCKLFTFKVFSAKLSKVQNFRIFNIFSLVSLLHSGAALFAAGIAITIVDSKKQIYYQCIDVLVLTGLNIAMAFFNTHKQKDFFLQLTPEGYSLHKKNNMIEEHLVAGTNYHQSGNDIEVEKGYVNMYNHALSSRQAIQFDKSSQIISYDQQSDNSLAGITQKHYQQISVQAQDIIDQKLNFTDQTNLKSHKTKNRSYEQISIQADQLLNANQKAKVIDLSQLPPQGFQRDSSNFTSFDMFKKVDRSVSAQMQAEKQDLSFQYDQAPRVDFSVQKYSSHSRADVSIQPSRKSMRDQSIFVKDQISQISQQDEQFQIQAEMQSRDIQPDIYYNQIAIQPSLDPSQQQIGIRYEKQGAIYNVFYQQIHQSNTDSNVLYEQQEYVEIDYPRELRQQRNQELQLRNDNVKSHQEQLEQRIRNKQKQLQQMRRKVQFKTRLNQKRKESLANKHISEQKVELGPIYYVQQRPDFNSRIRPPQSQRSQSSFRQQSLHDRQSKSKGKSQHTRSQKSQKINQNYGKNKKNTEDNTKNIFMQNDDDYENDQPQNTLQQINIINDSKETVGREQRGKTIEEIKLDSSSQRKHGQRVQDTKSQAPFRKNNANIEYNQIDDQLISQDSLDNQLLSGNNLAKRNRHRPKQSSDMIQLEQMSQSDKEPTGIMNHHYHQKPYLRQKSPSSLSGTIQQIRGNYNNVDHDKTINNLQKTQKFPARQSKIQKEQLTNFFSNNLPKNNNQRSKNKLPQQKDTQRFKINKLYSNNELKNIKNQQKIPTNIHNRQKLNNTFAMAAQNQLKDASVQKRQANSNNYPLNNRNQWQFQQEDRNISEDEEFSRKNYNVNRNNLVKKHNKNNNNFTSHMVLPQQSDKQNTSFHDLAKKHDGLGPKAANSKYPAKRSQVQQIEVHFSSQNNDNYQLPFNMNNQSPGIPRAFQQNRLASKENEDSLYEQESQQGQNYKNQMILEQMQKRPDNDDLQEYYQKKRNPRGSQEKRVPSRSKNGKSTEKIYMQKLDRYRK